jgi:hypothetical protein
MTIKYKLGFTIDSETLFSIMSKFLPIQDLSVEEILPRPDPRDVATIKPAYPNVLPPKKPRKQPPFPRAKRLADHAVNLHAGVNALIMTMLADGKEHHMGESHAPIKAAGYSSNGIYSRTQRLVRHGYVAKGTHGYHLTLKGKNAWEKRPFPALAVEDRALQKKPKNKKSRTKWR